MIVSEEDNARLYFMETCVVGSDKPQLRGEERDAEETEHFDKWEGKAV